MQQRNISRRRAQLRIATLFSSLVLIAPAVVQGQTVSTWWDPNSADEQVTGYDVCVGTSSGSCNVRVASVAAPSTSYTLSPTGGTLYYVAVRAKNAFGVSAYSPEVAFSIPSLGQPSNQTSVAGVAITPVNLSVVDPDGGSVTLTHTGLPVGLSLNSSTRRITGTPAAVGTYNVTVLANDGIVTVSRSFTWTVTSSGSGGGAPPANPTPPSGGTQINVSPGTVSRGAWITTSWSGIAVPSATDWIALYVPGTPNTAHIEWVFTSCSQTPDQASSSGSCPFAVPSNVPPGTYEVRLLANNGYTALATSAPFTVTATSGGAPPASAPPPSGGTQITASPGTVSRGAQITASWSGVAVPSATDWIALYVPGTPNTAHIEWVFTSCSQTPAQARSSGSCPFVVPSNLPPGTYEVRLLANNGYTALATSASFTVTATSGGVPPASLPPASLPPSSGGTQINASPGAVSRGTPITASWSGVAVPSATDWIGLYVPGTPNTSHIDFVFTSCSQAPGQAVSSGSCPFVVPSNVAPGTYEVRLLANNGYTALATSASFTVR